MAHIVGASGDDAIPGGPGRDGIRGEAGDDFLQGFGGGDLLFGGAGDDRVLGGRGGDSADAGEGDDRWRAAMVGHHDRVGLNDEPSAKSWNTSHPSRGGCGQEALRTTGGAGLFYCFAAN